MKDSIEFANGLPSAPDAERSILGAILLENDLFRVAHLLAPEDFSLDSHRRIFRAMGKLQSSDKPVDIVTLSQRLNLGKELQAVGGTAYLASLTEGLPRRLNVDSYVAIVREKALLRATIQASSRAMTRAGDQSEDAQTVLADVRADYEAIQQLAAPDTLETVAQYLSRAYICVDEFVKRNARAQGVPTGFNAFDDLTCGLQKQDLIILAARPSMGKTACAINVTANVALRGGKIVAVFSLEMGKDQLIDRIVCAEANLDLQAQREGRLTGQALDAYRYALAKLTDNERIFIDDVPAQTVVQIEAKAMKLKASTGLDMVVVDYLQLMRPEDAKESREQQVSRISRGLKAMAKRLNVPVLCLSQLSRENTKRQDKRPQLQDLRDSGSIEQDADVVAFIHREEYYAPDDESVRGKAELITAKQRNGPIGTIHLWWQSSCTRFSNDDPNQPTRMF